MSECVQEDGIGLLGVHAVDAESDGAETGGGGGDGICADDLYLETALVDGICDGGDAC